MASQGLGKDQYSDALQKVLSQDIQDIPVKSLWPLCLAGGRMSQQWQSKRTQILNVYPVPTLWLLQVKYYRPVNADNKPDILQCHIPGILQACLFYSIWNAQWIRISRFTWPYSKLLNEGGKTQTREFPIIGTEKLSQKQKACDKKSPISCKVLENALGLII